MSRILPPTDEEIREDILEILKDRFREREITPTYRIFAITPDVLAKFLPLRDEIMQDGAINMGIKEMLAVKVSLLNQCNPCSIGHIRRLKKIYGDEMVEEVAKFSVESDEGETKLGDKEQAALIFAEEAVLNRGRVREETFSRLMAYFSPKAVVEIIEVICLYMFLNTFNTLLDL
jgi:uncharacterized peroxidase-related enzyme